MNITAINATDKAIIEQVVAIADAHFAVGYLAPQQVIDYCNSPKNNVFVYQKNHQVLGFCLSAILDKTHLLEYTKDHPRVFECPADDAFGVIKTIAILPKVQKTGIGSALFAHAEQKLIQKSVNRIIIPAWVYADTMPIANIMKNHHYQPWFYVKQFWLDICNDELNCPKKQNNTCICDLHFHQKICI